MVRLGSVMAMAIAQARQALELVVRVSIAAETPSIACDTGRLKVGTGVCTKIPGVTDLVDVTGHSTPGHISTGELAVRVFGEVVCRPTRAAHGLGRSLSATSEEAPVQARAEKKTNGDITIIISSETDKEKIYGITFTIGTANGEWINGMAMCTLTTSMTMNGCDCVTGAAAVEPIMMARTRCDQTILEGDWPAASAGPSGRLNVLETCILALTSPAPLRRQRRA